MQPCLFRSRNFRFPTKCEGPWNKKVFCLPSSCEIPVASNPACSDPLPESMEKENSRCFSCFSCFSSASPPAAEGQTVSDEEQVRLPSASPSTETVSKKEQVGLPSTSSYTQTVSNLINAIREDAETVKPELDALIQKIYGLLEVIKTPKKSQKKTKRPISAGFSKSKDLLLETVKGISSWNDVLPAREASQVARDVVQGLGQAHWVTSGFLLIVYSLDRFETLSSNRESCSSLLEEMYNLAVDIKQLGERLTGWEDLAQGGAELIVEGSLICCSRFSSTTVDKDELLRFKEKIAELNMRIIRKMTTWMCSTLLCRSVSPPRRRECEYPNDAVGIEEPLNSVTKLLEWESEERAVAVIVHGFGGIGKTTLADAVFARYYVKDCKYSVVRLNSSPDIVKLQNLIVKDLMRSTEEAMTMSEGTEGDEILDFDDYVDGRRTIGKLLQQEVAFIYIDNVLDRDSLQQLLPTRQLKNAKKLRVLITARNRDVLRGCEIKMAVYPMETLSVDHARTLLIKEMYKNVTADINPQITDSQLNEMVKRSRGVPKLVQMIAGLIRSEPNKDKAYHMVMQDSEKLTGDTFTGINEYIFSYDYLPDECKNPFLDICYFFKGWEWETVANIVGESQLDVLEKRALVSKDKDMICLHDVLLTMGKVKAQDTRFDFARGTASEIEEFFEKDMKYLELVKGLWFSDQACDIPITKLNSMRNSLRVFGHKMQQEESFQKMELGEGQPEPIFHELLVYKGESPHCPFKWSWLKKLRFLGYRPQNLEVLHKIPSSNLKHIELDGSLCSVREILSSDIQQLQALQVLRLIDFHNLEKLPEEWGEYLRENLKELTLSNCTAMKRLTGSISQLKSLKILKLDNCCNLRRWPKHCESLSSSLQKLSMLNCRKLKWLPSCFAEALDSDSRLLFQDNGILSDAPQSGSDSNYESDED